MNIANIARSDTAAQTPSRVHTAAVQFEAMLLQQMVKPLATSFSQEEDGDMKEAGPLQSFAGEAVAGSLARSGALGFARQIEETLAQSAAKKMSQNDSSPDATGR